MNQTPGEEGNEEVRKKSELPPLLILVNYLYHGKTMMILFLEDSSVPNFHPLNLKGIIKIIFSYCTANQAMPQARFLVGGE